MMKKTILFLLLITSLIVFKETKREAESSLASQAFTELLRDPAISVTVSAYSPTEEECDSDPFITAFQKPVREGTIAISRDLEKELGWREGDRIHIHGLGVFEVNDRMAFKWKKRVDIFFHDTEKALSFGIKQANAVKIDVPQNNLKKKV